MSVKIRLSRRGSKKRPFNHIVVANSRAPRDGNFIEKVGTYNPMLPKEDATRITLVVDRIKYWLSQGAQPTDRVARFLGDAGIIAKYVISDKQTKQPLPKAKAQARVKEIEAKKLQAAENKKQAEEQAKAEFEKPIEAAPVAETPVEEAKPTETAPKAPAEETAKEKPAA